jgi:hypothetical protein
MANADGTIEIRRRVLFARLFHQRQRTSSGTHHLRPGGKLDDGNLPEMKRRRLLGLYANPDRRTRARAQHRCQRERAADLTEAANRRR